MSMDHNNITPEFWFYQIGANVLSSDTVNKTPIEHWSKYQDKSIPINLLNKVKETMDLLLERTFLKYWSFRENP